MNCISTEINAEEERAKATYGGYLNYDKTHFNCIDRNNNICNCKINKKYHIKYTGRGFGFYVNNIDCGINLGKQHGDNIVRLFNKENLQLPSYFLKHVESVRRQDNPTPEEMEKDRINKEIRMQNEKQEKEKRIALNTLINNTKASSRLEKLRAKHII